MAGRQENRKHIAGIGGGVMTKSKPKAPLKTADEKEIERITPSSSDTQLEGLLGTIL
jgi:hypothetical protein